MQLRTNRWLILLILGDTITFLLVTLFGFASHGTLDSAGLRLLTTFAPLLISWLLVAPHLKVYDYKVVIDYRQLWRPFWAMVLAGPMAAWLRGLILSAPIIPLFVIILGGVSAIAILFWRGLFWLVVRRLVRGDG
jgi:hypothetical protein